MSFFYSIDWTAVGTIFMAATSACSIYFTNKHMKENYRGKLDISIVNRKDFGYIKLHNHGNSIITDLDLSMSKNCDFYKTIKGINPDSMLFEFLIEKGNEEKCSFNYKYSLAPGESKLIPLISFQIANNTQNNKDKNGLTIEERAKLFDKIIAIEYNYNDGYNKGEIISKWVSNIYSETHYVKA